jgi:threonine dehydrogenase-like Zn-dependent dehydrogenase
MTTHQSYMRAAVFAGDGVLDITERPWPELQRPDDVILGVEVGGICGTDLKILERPQAHPATPGVVLGHEILGVVAESGPESGLETGDRVVVAPNFGCGVCVYCRRGLVNQCPRMTTIGIYEDGGLADRVRVPAATCHRISSAVPAELAVLAEPLSGVVNGVRLANPFPGETAVVLGAGPAGLMFTALFAAAGVHVVTVEPTAERAQLAAALGADETLDPRAGDVTSDILEITDGVGADIVVDAVGSQFSTALRAVRSAGRVVLFGMNTTARAETAQERITRRELSILGAYVGGQDVIPLAVGILERGVVDLSPMVTHRIGVDGLPMALDEFRRGGAVKIEVSFS